MARRSILSALFKTSKRKKNPWFTRKVGGKRGRPRKGLFG